MLNDSFSSIIPFKDQINSFEWTKFFKDFNGIRYRIESQELFFEETVPNELTFLENFFSKLNFPFKKLDSPRTIIFTKQISIPQISDNIFFEILSQYYFCNVSDTIQKYTLFLNSIISDVVSHIRILSDSQHPLKIIIESLKRNIPFEEMKPVFDSLMEKDIWRNIIKENKITHNFRTVSINTWLHILRHPSNSKTNLLSFLQYLNGVTNDLQFVATNVPLIDPLGKSIFTLTYLDKEIFSQPLIELENSKTQDIISYWLILGSLILRNINYALLKFSNLSLEGFNHDDIAFYEYLKPKLTQFTESCYNQDLVESYKQYESPRHKLVFNSIRGHELYTYNRSSILEFHMKKAQQEFKKFPEKKIIRKRVNRRSNKLYAFLNDVLLIYKDFLNEISDLTKANGNYTSIDKIVKKYNL